LAVDLQIGAKLIRDKVIKLPSLEEAVSLTLKNLLRHSSMSLSVVVLGGMFQGQSRGSSRAVHHV
jgi:hypothetical protein